MLPTSGSVHSWYLKDIFIYHLLAFKDPMPNTITQSLLERIEQESAQVKQHCTLLQAECGFTLKCMQHIQHAREHMCSAYQLVQNAPLATFRAETLAYISANFEELNTLMRETEQHYRTLLLTSPHFVAHVNQ